MKEYRRITPSPKEALRREREAARRQTEDRRRRYLRRLRAAVVARREEMVIAAVVRGHRDVAGIAWWSGLEAAHVRRAIRGLVHRHRGQTLEGAVRREVAARCRR